MPSERNFYETKIRKGVIIALLALLAVLLSAFVAGWCMFGTQLRAVGTIEEVEEHLYRMEYRGDYGFDDFFAQGGAETDAEMADYIASFLSHGFWKPDAGSMPGLSFGCSTLAAKNDSGDLLFGRNYDWTDCETMIVHTVPDHGYESISTCCLDFLGFGEGFVPVGMMNKMMSLAAVYVPLDGMNEKGLCVADLMAGDDVETHQHTDKPDLTVTPMIRLLLDRAANVEEALVLLAEVDMHSSIGSAHHLSIADASGRSVVVEYIGNEMFVTNTPVLTNHYLTPGDKFGIGSEQSHQRFDRLTQQYLDANGAMTPQDMRDCLQSVSQGTFPGSDEKTQWSIVYFPAALTADYYFREDYAHTYSTVLLDKSGWLYLRGE